MQRARMRRRVSWITKTATFLGTWLKMKENEPLAILFCLFFYSLLRFFPMHFHLFLVSGKIVCSASSWTGDSSMECEKYSCWCHKNIHNNHNNSNIQVFYVCSSDFSSLLCMCVRFSVFHSVCFGMFHIFHVRTRWSEHSVCIVISLSRHATHNTISIYLFMSSFFVYHYQINIEIFHISLYQVAIFHLSWAPLLARLISGCKAQHHSIFV